MQNRNNAYFDEIVLMVYDTLNEYIKYHRKKEYTDSIIQAIEEFLNDNKQVNYSDKKYGGTIEILRKDFSFNVSEIEKVFMTRHSIREFEDSDVDREILIKALRLAQRAPSACNRQGVRIYVVQGVKCVELAKELSGIGGLMQMSRLFAYWL